jgi:uncharacterized protein YdcH (DUF465 family)
MSVREEELIQKLIKENEEFARVKQSHLDLARQLDEIENKPFLTPQDEVEVKVLKKRKLACKDQMERILVHYR